MSVWEEIQQKLNIEDVIGEYVPIRQAGVNYKCVCPFHSEKNPSLMISPDKQIWHCFGCGVGGTMFTFVEMFENISKREALHILAKKAGVKLDDFKSKNSNLGNSQNQDSNNSQDSDTQASNYQKGFQILEWTAEIYHKFLLKLLQDRQNPVTKYCLERGFTSKIISQFKIGYAPNGSQILGFAKKFNLDLDLLEKTGILKKFDSGTYKDKYQDRLVFPIFDLKGRVAGFTGRVLPYDKSDRPKYLNSPQTEWFNKSEIWFGWHLARRSILQEKKAFLVEGNVDVVSAFKSDLENVLASQGTSFTTSQLKILHRLVKTVVLAFDNDNAGLIAQDKLYVEAAKNNFEIQKLIIPSDFKDLDEWLSSSDFPGIEHLPIKPYLDYVLEREGRFLGGGDVDKQQKSLKQFLDLVSYNSPTIREHYLQKLEKITGFSKKSLDLELGVYVDRNQKNQLRRDNSKQNPEENTEDLHLSHISQRSLDVGVSLLLIFQEIGAILWFLGYPLAPLSGGADYPSSSVLMPQREVEGSIKNDSFSSIETPDQDSVNNSTEEKNTLVNFAEFIFPLAANLSPDLNKSETFRDFINQNKDQLELILSSKNYDPSSIPEIIENLKNSLIRLFDGHVSRFMLSQDLKERYMSIKQSHS